ncbi:Neuronal pentraxin-1-like 2 [Homarus americanus]|uniref:Neuronal pentraxin-1-like 2 n=1 Tax=Homarus americanus TaxID=6706 RepID=A0A8J5KJM0_HOMAM|nr:Neuronal pentraxin-1-like 2 [Homarus americanus]
MFVPHKVPLPVKGIITVGQEQDLLAGAYDTDQSFRGHIAQVNIWNRSLTPEEVKEQASCNKAPLGNIFSTDRENVELLGGASVELVKSEHFCQKSVEYVIFPEARYMAESRLVCTRIGYEVYTPQDREENIILHQESLRFAEKCLSNYHLWIGVTDEEVEDVWRKFTDNSVAETQFELNEPNGGTGENCMLMFLPNGLWVDTSCVIRWPACVPCEVDRTSPLRLRGFCFSNEAETYYEVLGYKREKPYMHGYYGFIVYKTDTYTWEMFDTTTGEVVGILEVPTKDSYPIGRNIWTLKRSMCDYLIGTQLQMSFSICDNDEFTCANGDCIPKELRYNAKDDCVDLSDEEDCQLIILPKGYRSERPPDNETEGLAIYVAPTVDVLRFMEISDIRRVSNVEFLIEIRWNDPRLKYQNLGETLEWNTLSAVDMDRVWRPKINFPNVYDGNIKMLSEDLFLDKIGIPLPPEFNNVRMDTVYDGKSATLVQQLHYR